MSTESETSRPSMLVRFVGENARSFRDSFELSLLASRLSEPGVPRSIPWRDGDARINVLPVACVFGANASGKSNVLRAMADMRGCVLQSFRSGDAESRIPRRPFMLDGQARSRPTRFEIDVVLDGVRHEYGFVFDDERFLEEWAFHYPRGKQATLFERDGMKVRHGAEERHRGRVVEQLLRPNALYLSAAGAAGHEVLEPLLRWFRTNLVLAEAANRGLRHARTFTLLDDPDQRQRVVQLLQVADLGIVDLETQEPDPDFVERMRKAVRVLQGKEGEPDTSDSDLVIDGLTSLRLFHSGAGDAVPIDIGEESLGTVVWLGLVGPLMDALDQGTVLLADELDSSLHPLLVREIVRLFQDPATNAHGAQLVCNAFDTALLGDSVPPRHLGRDQVWLTEKAHDGATKLYSLADFAPRKEEDVAGRYLRGRYGAVPVVDHRELAIAAGSVNGE